MTEYELEEDKIIKILTQVQVMKREAEMQLEKQQFGEKRKINRTKKGESFKKKRKNQWTIIFHVFTRIDFRMRTRICKRMITPKYTGQTKPSSTEISTDLAKETFYQKFIRKNKEISDRIDFSRNNTLRFQIMVWAVIGLAFTYEKLYVII